MIFHRLLLFRRLSAARVFDKYTHAFLLDRRCKVPNLATNAAKHGALSTPDGRVFINWEIKHQSADPTLDFSWTERVTASQTASRLARDHLQRLGDGLAELRSRLPPQQSQVVGAGTNTGTNAGVATSAAARKRRRQAKTWLALTSYCRATTETDAPGRDVAATISRFSASGQRLFRRRSALFVSTSDIVLQDRARRAVSRIELVVAGVCVGLAAGRTSGRDAPRHARRHDRVSSRTSPQVERRPALSGGEGRRIVIPSVTWIRRRISRR